MTKLGFALQAAEQAHADQKDKAGEPYIWHLIRVAETVRRGGYAEWLQIVALLHDSIEDGHLTKHAIELHFGKQVAETVDVLTRRESDKGRWDHHDYEVYIRRVAKDQSAAVVKLADLEDNLNRDRMPRPWKIEDYERWGRYEWAKSFLSHLA